VVETTMLSKHISFIYYVAFLGSTVFLFSKHLKDEISNQKDQVYNIASNIPPFQKELSKNVSILFEVLKHLNSSFIQIFSNYSYLSTLE